MKSHLKNKSNIILLSILLLLCMNKSHAADEEKLLSNSESTIQKEISSLPLLKEETIRSSNKELDKEKVFFRTLNGIIKSIRLQKKEIVEKSNLLKKAKTEQDKVNIQLKIDSLDLLIKEQERSFELLQTG